MNVRGAQQRLWQRRVLGQRVGARAQRIAQRAELHLRRSRVGVVRCRLGTHERAGGPTAATLRVRRESTNRTLVKLRASEAGARAQAIARR
eukprot:3316840-Pleurochrysis_carterae.AAC.4